MNAVLRRATREARPIVAKLRDTTPQQAALAHSHPEWIAQLWDRGSGRPNHAGVARQIGAIQASGDRTAQLRTITAPTLVVHGDVDRMVHPSGGRATAAAIPAARHVEIPGMRHHLAPGVQDRLVELISSVAVARA